MEGDVEGSIVDELRLIGVVLRKMDGIACYGRFVNG